MRGLSMAVVALALCASCIAGEDKSNAERARELSREFVVECIIPSQSKVVVEGIQKYGKAGSETVDFYGRINSFIGSWGKTTEYRKCLGADAFHCDNLEPVIIGRLVSVYRDTMEYVDLQKIGIAHEKKHSNFVVRSMETDLATGQKFCDEIIDLLAAYVEKQISGGRMETEELVSRFREIHKATDKNPQSKQINGLSGASAVHVYKLTKERKP